MNKKYLLIGVIGVVTLIPLMLIVLFPTSNTIKSSSKSPTTTTSSSALDSNMNGSNSQSNTPNTASNPTEDPTQLPQNVALQFYQDYTTAKVNPLVSGTYKTYPHLSKEYKQVIEGLIDKKYDENFDPVFCIQNRTKAIATSEPTYTKSGMEAEVKLQKNDGLIAKDMYRVTLVKDASTKWLITDTICVPQKP